MAYPVPNLKNPRPLSSPSSLAGGSPQIGRGEGGQKKSSWLKGLITLIIIIIVISGGIYLITGFTGISAPGGGDLKFKTNWQAVFLTNGQVYFGKIGKITKDLVILKDIYYLQVITRPLQRSQEGTTPSEAPQQEQQLTLIKLGNEIHGPRDEMIINRDQVVIIEDLKEDSRVVQAINDYLKGNQPNLNQ